MLTPNAESMHEIHESKQSTLLETMKGLQEKIHFVVLLCIIPSFNKEGCVLRQ